MEESKVNRSSLSIGGGDDNVVKNELLVVRPKAFDIIVAFPNFIVQIPQRLQNCVQSHLKKLLVKDGRGTNSIAIKEKDSYTALKLDAHRQLKAWKDNPTWVDDQSPEIKVSVPKGSLCNLNVNVKIGLPPDAIYDIVTDPENKRVFKNIKEVISRKVLVDDGSRQVVEVEQAALWRFLWWSGTISVHVMVDQNREDYSMKFTQVKTGFMKRFEGSWRVQPIFVDENLCSPLKPKTWGEYDSCTGGKGRVGSIVSLEQLIQPAMVPPPPISWYLRGITSKTTEMLIYDLLAEAARIRGDFAAANSDQEPQLSVGLINENLPYQLCDVKARWAHHRRNTRRCKNRRRFSA